MPLFILIFLLIFLPITSPAAIYKMIAADGSLQFTDAPMPGFNLIELRQMNVYSAQATATSNEKNNDVAKPGSNKHYTEFSLLQPQNQETFYNQAAIPIQIQLQPKLATGDQFELWLDGHKLPDINGNSTTLNNPDPGEHQLQAKLISATKEILMTTDVITFYVHHSNINPTI